MKQILKYLSKYNLKKHIKELFLSPTEDKSDKLKMTIKYSKSSEYTNPVYILNSY